MYKIQPLEIQSVQTQRSTMKPSPRLNLPGSAGLDIHSHTIAGQKLQVFVVRMAVLGTCFTFPFSHSTSPPREPRSLLVFQPQALLNGCQGSAQAGTLFLRRVFPHLYIHSTLSQCSRRSTETHLLSFSFTSGASASFCPTQTSCTNALS